MERKLLSLPSFFVLLLIAGIAFLAAPVEDVDAAAPTLTSITAPSGVENAAFAVTFTFSEDLTASTFAAADIDATFRPADGDDDGSDDVTLTPTVPTSGVALTAYLVNVSAPPGNVEGTITVGLSTDANGDIDAAFTADDGSTTAFVPASPTTTEDDPTSVDVAFDSIAPAVLIELADGVSGTQNGPFEIKITLTETNPVATGAGVFVVANAPATAPDTPDHTTGDIKVTGGSMTENERVGATNVWRAIITPTASTPSAPITEVKVEVAASSVMDTAGNSSGAASLTPAVVIDNLKPTITLAPAGTADDAITSSGTTHTGGTGDFKIRVTIMGGPLGSGTGDDFVAKTDLKVSDGGVSGEQSADPSTLADDYIVTISQDDSNTTTTVKIEVLADVIKDAAGNGNAATDDTVDPKINASLTVNVSGGSAPVDPGTREPTSTGVGAPLPGDQVGFMLDTSIVIPANKFVVLARSPKAEDAGFTAAISPDPIDIDDNLWQNLRHFLVTTEGGTIDLIGPVGRPVKSVVISEVMWGNDNGLSDPTNSQWIELYNTTGADIDLMNWKLQFSTKDYGQNMFTGDDAKASASATTGALTDASNPVVDKLSTWREVGNYWLWEITDTAGGKYGQSGKSTRNSATSPGNPFELISMQRKIDYAKVEKGDHDPDTVKNRNKQLEGIPGTGSGNWEASPEHGHLSTYRKGTPGAAPSIKKHDKTGVPRGSVVFNEIANRSDKKHDWIELYNKSSSAKKINGWELSLVTATDTDTELFIFTSDDDINVPAKGYLLIVNTDPRNTTLEGGYDVVNPGNSARQSDGAGTKPSRLYYVSDKLDIPNEKFLLILRNGNDKTGTHEKIEDIAGNNPDFPKNADNTDVWPLRVWDLGATNDLGEKNDKTWTRDQGKAVFHGDEWKDNGGFTGVGIDRKYGSSDSYTSGTPGYANNAVQNEIKSDGLTHANPVIISEIMFGAGNGRVPQWIELHNPSHTQTVNLKNWKLDILNYYSDETLEVDHSATLTLPEVRIQPNQTVLIVSTSGRNSGSDEFPDDRIINVWSNTDLRQALSMQDRRDAILSATGFHLKLSDPGKKVVDEVGNIDANRRTNDEPDWTLPGGNFDGSRRSSMVRDLAGSANDGTDRDSWRDAVGVLSDTIKADELYYGDNEDVGTPGYTPGGVLPVQLSSFYSKRNDTGAVVITWSTESELDNAGFNILRSQSRTGEFVRINAQLIPGAGTTGEKTAYTWTDTGASPNVLYFYQIEDVSLAGDHRTLRTTRLRGYIGAAGKATTTWGDLKSRE